MIDPLRQAVYLGIAVFDTAKVYGPRTNEELVGEALKPVRNRVAIADRCGWDVGAAPDGVNSRPEHIKATADQSLRRLRTDHIDFYYQHLSAPR